MRLFKFMVTLAGLAGVLGWSISTVEASGCCRSDCFDAYGTMVANGVPASQTDPWLTECYTNCDEHGTPDPSYCPAVPNA
jgi:hypothetical protein